MKNWDEDLAKIMEKKMKKYKEQIDNNLTTNNNHDKDISGPITLTDYNFDETTQKIFTFSSRFLGSLVWPL